MPRPIIFHYHLFKNAGSSVDAILAENFPGRWVTREFVGLGPKAMHAAVAAWIDEERDAVAFSSHTASLATASTPGVHLFPVVFLRNPIDRIASAYAFERDQPGDRFGAVLARHTSLAGYVEVRLSLVHDRQCRNYQAHRLAEYVPEQVHDEAEAAHRAIDRLPFIGVVEAFDQSLARLQALLGGTFPGFTARPVARNVTSDPSEALDSRLRRIQAQLGTDLFDRLAELNALDTAIHCRVRDSAAAPGQSVARPPTEPRRGE